MFWSKSVLEALGVNRKSQSNKVANRSRKRTNFRLGLERLETRELMAVNPLAVSSTILGETDGTFDFVSTDWNHDGVSDLVAIKKSHTGTSSTEIHILDGASKYQRWLLQTGTALHETDSSFAFAMADWNNDGTADLVAIKKSGTGTHTTEVHILDGRSGFKQFSVHTGTALHETDSTFDFAVADWNRDGKPDLVAIKKSGTGTHSTEVHILDGRSGFKQFSLHTGTVLHETDGTFEFGMTDWNRDGKPDLVAIKKSGTGTHSSEVHVLDGKSGFKRFSLQTGSALLETDVNFEFVVTESGSKPAQIMAVKKGTTDSHKSEVITVAGAMKVLGTEKDDQILVTEAGGKVRVTVNNVVWGIYDPALVQSIEIYGGAGNDLIDGRGTVKPMVIFGGTGNDTLYGGRGDDLIFGDSGNDSLYGGAGNDFLYGGDGDDILKGEMGTDSIFGNNGNDTLFGGEGLDYFDGGEGYDVGADQWGEKEVREPYNDFVILGIKLGKNHPGDAMESRPIWEAYMQSQTKPHVAANYVGFQFRGAVTIDNGKSAFTFILNEWINLPEVKPGVNYEAFDRAEKLARTKILSLAQQRAQQTGGIVRSIEWVEVRWAY